MSAVLAPIHRFRSTDLVSHCYQSLRAELLDAARTAPDTIVRTPGFGIPYTATQVVVDHLDGDDTDSHELLRIMSAAAEGEDVQLRASAWLARAAGAHARFHADDLAAELAS